MKLNPKVVKVALNARKLVVDNAPAILTGMAAGTCVAAVAEGIHATVKAVRTYDSLNIDHVTKENVTDVAVAIVPHYVPTLVLTAVSVACAIGAHGVSARRYAALSAAYELAEQGLRDWKEKTAEVVGEKKTEKIADEVAKGHLQERGYREEIVYDTGHGTQLCYDAPFGRYFYSSMERIRQAQNDINEQIIGDWSATLNEFYYALGLPAIGKGDDLGWNTSNMLSIKFTSDLVSDGKPVLVMEYEVYPEYRDL